MATESTYAIDQLLRRRKVDVIFDIGANVGQTARSYRQLFPDAKIHSFEPSDPAFSTLETTFAGDQKFKAWKLAISNVDGEKDFFCSDDDTCNSLLPPSQEIGNAALREKLTSTRKDKVECSRLDSFCQQNSIGRIDLLKMDIQGAELQAIEGASEKLGSGDIGLVFSEVQFSPLYKDACEFRDISSAMNMHGYKLYGLYNLHHFLEDGLLWGDAIFVHPSILR